MSAQTVPANDNFSNRIVLSGTAPSTTGSNVNATKEAGEPNHANNAGGKSVWWSWTAPGPGSVTVDRTGSGFFATVAIYTGDSVNALSSVASSQSLTATFVAAGGTTYQIAIDGFSGASGSIALSVTFTASVAPMFTSHPTPRSVIAGVTTTFVASASGFPAPSLRWQRKPSGMAAWSDLSNSGGYSGVTTGTLTVSSTTPAMSGDQFRCVASNVGGEITSDAASLTVSPVPASPALSLNQTLASTKEMVNASTTVFPNSTSLQSFTVEVWFNPSALAQTKLVPIGFAGTGRTYLATDDAWDLGFDFQRQISGAESYLVGLTVYGANGQSAGGIANAYPPWQMVNQWHHFAAMFDANTRQITLAFDGVVNATPFTVSATAFPVFSNNLSIGGFGPSASSGFFPGAIDEIRISDIVRYSANFTPSPHLAVDSNTRALWHFSEGAAATSFVDSGPSGFTLTSYNGASTAVLPLTDPAPTINAAPADQIVSAGTSAIFSVTSSDATPPAFQWQRKAAGGATWSNLLTGGSYSGVTSSTLTVSPVTGGMNGDQFRCVATNSAGTTTTTSATLTVNAATVAPAITTHPANQIVTAGASATFTVAASGSPAPTYQWERLPSGSATWSNLANGSSYSGVTATSLTVSATMTAMSGDQFRCVATNTVSSATSNAAALTVNAANVAPVITTQPTNQTVTAGANATFTVVTSGTPAPTYQWQRLPNGSATWSNLTNGGSYSGATTTTLTVSATTTAMSGDQVRCIATNTGGNATSNAATLTVNAATVAPAITTHPVGQTVTAGANATFNVAASGTPVPSFQWQRLPSGSATWANLTNGDSYSGVTSTTLTVSGTTTAMSGDQFRCVASNSVGNATSNAGTLTVNPASIAPTITTQPTNQTVIAGASASFSVAASGSPTPTFKWQRLPSGSATWSDITNGGAYAGATTTTLTIGAVATAMSGDQFRCVATNSVGFATSNAASLTVDAGGLAPAITSVSAPRQTVNFGQSLTLSVSATGTPAPTFQWKRNGLPVPGATSSSFTIGSAASPDNGYYQLVATNSSGSATSAVIFVNVVVTSAQLSAWGANLDGQTTVPAGLTNVASASAGGGFNLVLKGDGTVTAWGLNADGQATVPAGLANVVGVSGGTFHSLALKSDGTVAAWGNNIYGQRTVPAGMTNVVAVSAGGAHNLALKSDGSVVAWGLNSYGQTSVPAGLTNVIAIAAGGFHSLALRSDGTVAAWGANIDGQRSVPAGLSGVVAITAGGYHSVALKSDGTIVAWGSNVHGESTVPSGLTNVVEVSAGGFHTLALKNDGTIVAWGWDSDGQRTVPAGLTGTVDVMGGGYHSLALRGAGSGVAPTITSQPIGQVATAGGSIVLSVTATGAGTLTYQWRLDGADIAGATAPNYTIASSQRFHDGSYTVVVTANGMSTTSDAAMLAINVPPPSNARLLNLSTRGLAQAGDNVLIPGFVVSGTGTKRLLIRAVGPTLGKPPFGLAGVLSDPRMRLLRRNPTTQAFEEIAANDNWATNPNADNITRTAEEVFAFPFNDDREAALLFDLAPGEYTAIAGGVNNATGLAIVELYDADTGAPSATLINISNRGFCGAGDQVMIPGFVISADGPKTVLVRVVGPRLAGFGVPGTMADPKLEVFPGGASTPILTNDNWGDNADAVNTAQIAEQVSAFALSAGSKDAAFVVTLPPGLYTVVGSSATAGGTGVVLVEVYVVP